MTLVFGGLLITTLSVVVGSNLSRTASLGAIVEVTGQQSLLLVVIGTFFSLRPLPFRRRPHPLHGPLVSGLHLRRDSGAGDFPRLSSGILR